MYIYIYICTCVQCSCGAGTVAIASAPDTPQVPLCIPIFEVPRKHALPVCMQLPESIPAVTATARICVAVHAAALVAPGQVARCCGAVSAMVSGHGLS